MYLLNDGILDFFPKERERDLSASKEVVQEVKGGKQELIWVEQLDRYFEQQTDQAY